MSRLTIPARCLGVLGACALFVVPAASSQEPAGFSRVIGHFPADSITFRPRARLPETFSIESWTAALNRAIDVDREARLRAWIAPVPADSAAEAARILAIGRYADVGIELRSRLEFKMDRLKNERCFESVTTFTPGCRSGFPTPGIGQQFAVRAGGVIGDRVHVNVDYDTEREFSASNSINIYYQGLGNEVLRRVDIGNVTFEAPRSRLITTAIPGNSFGVQALARVGALELRSVAAQQRGSSLRTRVFSVGTEATQPVDRELRDLDFEPGRFFFVIDPRALPGYPAIDILTLDASALPPSARVIEARVYRLRAQSGHSGANPNLGGIDAVAIRRDGPQRVGPFSWERMIEGRDYYLDPSGAWFALATRAGNEDYLAVSYITAAGDTVGTFPSINRGGGDTLELVYEPRRGPEVATFAHEMRNVYRLGGGSVNRPSIALSILLNEAERPLDNSGTYLARLGMARAADASSFDQYNRVFPRERDPGGGLPIRDLFVVFPHLRPFADPVLDPRERNDSLYRTPAYLLSSQGPPPRFRLRLYHEATGAGDRTSLNLGAIQVREGSEKLTVGNRDLIRGRDYLMAYDVGLVTFLNPDSLFLGPTQVLVQFEENQRFDDAPKNNFGFSSTYHLGGVGTISAIGMYQAEQTLLTRPPLGFEPRSGMIGGLSTDLAFRGEGLTRFLDGLPLLRVSAPSTLSVRGELDVSRPSGGRQTQAFVDEFENTSALQVRLLQNAFQLGSAPSSARGLGPSYQAPGGGFALPDAVPIVWQNAVQLGGRPVEFESRQIDTSIVLAGATRQIETVLWLTLKADTVGGLPDAVSGLPRWRRPPTPGPRWRSLTQALDRTGLGVDLSRTEYLEFWVLEDADRVARSQGAALLFDFGSVFEDAAAVAPDTFRAAGRDTVFTGFRALGSDRLDTEKDSLTNVFNAVVNDIGTHMDRIDSIVDAGTGMTIRDLPTCQLSGAGIPSFPLGDLSSNCTRRNGFADTEDLNGDNRLDVTVGVTQEDLIRYVFPVGEDRYFVREGAGVPDASGRLMTWRLYRIPFRADSLQVGQPGGRQIRALRITLAAPAMGSMEREFSFALARVRLVGAPWVKRAPTPIAGIAGSRGEPHGEVLASIVSTENQDLGYTSPPGVLDQADRIGAEVQIGSEQINEQSLRVLARDLRVGERAEAFVRFSDEADRNFLRYRMLRAWARGRGPGWEDGDLEFFLKVGRDENNFYLYRTPAKSQSWEPEIVVDMERWQRLRAVVETAWLRGEAPSGSGACGGDSTAYVACDGPYVVHVRDPGISPPNLARVSDVAVGILRRAQSVVADPAEVWVDDIRLSGVVANAGLAGTLDARLTAGDFADVSVSYLGRDPQFRQLGEDPGYVGGRVASLASTFQAARLVPESWGLNIPVSVAHVRTSDDPFYVSRGDVRADAIAGLREPRGTSTTVQALLRRARRGESAWERLLLDPLTVTMYRQDAGATAELSDARTHNRQWGVRYANPPGPRTVPLPGFIGAFVARLPSWLRDSEFGRALSAARLRWNPYTIRLASLLTDHRTERSTFRVPVASAADSAIAPLASVIHTWRNEAGVDLRPFSSALLRVDYSRVQDLHDYGDTTSLGRVLEAERQTFLGRDAGFERARSLVTTVGIAPVVGRWLRPRLAFTSTFAFNRDPGGHDPVRAAVDSTFIAPHTLANSRRRELGATADLGLILLAAAGDSGVVGRLARMIQPVDLVFARERRSSFDRAPFFPGLGYQLGLGGLEDFRSQRGVPATGSAELRTTSAAGGLDLPLGFRVRALYQDLESVNWIRRGSAQSELRQDSREWPSGSVAWLYSPRGGVGRVLSSVTSQARYRRAVSSTSQPMLGIERTFTENSSVTVNPALTIAWAGGVVTGGQYSRTRAEALTSGNVTRSNREDWTGSLAFSFRAPASLVRLRSPLRSTWALTTSDISVCLVRAGSDECVPVSDSRRRQADVRLDTGFSPTITGGAAFGYVLTEQRHTATRLSQMLFTVFAEINFSAGQIR